MDIAPAAFDAPEPVVSALDADWFQPGRPPNLSPRRYKIAPLSYRQRSALQRDIRRQAGPEIDRAVALDVLRQAMRELAPANLHEILADIDAAELQPQNSAAQARLAVIEHAAAGVSAYDDMQDSHQRHREARVLCTVRHVLRGWDGPGLPPFYTAYGLVPDELIDAIPAAELDAIFGHANVLLYVGPSAVGNSAPPSPSPGSQTPTPEG